MNASDLEQAAGRALGGALPADVDPISPLARETAPVNTTLPVSIVERLRKIEQLNYSRTWTLKQDVALLEQLSKTIPISKIGVDGKSGERAASHRITVLNTQLPGIIAEVRRISSANELLPSRPRRSVASQWHPSCSYQPAFLKGFG